MPLGVTQRPGLAYVCVFQWCRCTLYEKGVWEWRRLAGYDLGGLDTLFDVVSNSWPPETQSRKSRLQNSPDSAKFRLRLVTVSASALAVVHTLQLTSHPVIFNLRRI
jgi:hypothetical protein